MYSNFYYLGMKYINVSEYATERDLLDGYDDVLDTKILDDDALIGLFIS